MKLFLCGSAEMDPEIKGDHIYKVDNYPTPNPEFIDIVPNNRSVATMGLMVELLGKDARVLIEEPSENKPYECDVEYDFFDGELHDERVGMWLNDKYYITKYFDHDTYGPDEPVHVTFGVDFIITGDLFRELKTWAQKNREVVELYIK